MVKGKRANNVISGTKSEQLKLIRNDIAQFKAAKNLDQVIILWTANTERFSEIITGVNDTADNLLKAIEEDHLEISPSTMFAVAAALEGVRYRERHKARDTAILTRLLPPLHMCDTSISHFKLVFIISNSI